MRIPVLKELKTFADEKVKQVKMFRLYIYPMHNAWNIVCNIVSGNVFRQEL